MSESYLKLKVVSEITAKDLCEAARNGDPLALKAFDMTAMYLGRALANSVAYLSPEAIVLFGGLAGAGDLLTIPTKKYMEEFMLNIFKDKVKIILSELHEGDAAILGSAALAWHSVNEKVKAV
jgi:glucokinase